MRRQVRVTRSRGSPGAGLPLLPGEGAMTAAQAVLPHRPASLAAGGAVI
jgi:hypothetical protein